jgi:ubiquinone/menaquinone biosynthesis C-methylase UbiE
MATWSLATDKRQTGNDVMTLLEKIKDQARRLLRQEVAPAEAYDKWAPTYDAQPGNLMLNLDEQIFSRLLHNISCKGKMVVDIGCGTGRHWDKILSQHPQQLIGYDVSAGMLRQLQQKYPQAHTHLIVRDRIQYAESRPAEVLISTLALAHIKKPGLAMQQWCRILKPGAEVLLTDYHPETLALGGDRTFVYQGRCLAIKNYVHPIEKVKQYARENGFEVLTFIERRIDPAVKPYYEKQETLGVYERFKGAGIIYGMHLRKQDATQ